MKKTAKKLLTGFSFSILMVILLCFYAGAEGTVLGTGECGAKGDNVIWTYYDDDTLVISGNGKMMDFPVEELISYKKFCFDNKRRYNNLVIDNGVTYVGKYAFEYSPAKSVVIADTVTDIAENAFSFCENLQYAVIGKGMQYIDHDAFYECNDLRFVYFTGTKSEWESVNVAYSNYRIINAVVHFNSTLPIDHEPEYVEKVVSEGSCGDVRECDYICSCGDKYTVRLYIYHEGGAATCVEQATCELCGEKYGSLNKERHGKLVYTPHNEPTCTVDGNLGGTSCSLCGAIIEADEILPATGHFLYNTTTKATLSKNGKITRKCSICDYVESTKTIYYPKTIKLSKTTYTYTGKVITPTVTVKDSAGKTLKKDTDYTVKYASGRKSTGKYTVSVTFKGKYSGTKKLTFNILPKATSKVTATQTTTSVKAKWSKVTGASGYKVQLISSKNKTLKTVYTTKLEYNFTKLSKGTSYKVKVTAYKTIDSKKVYSTSSKTLTTATKPATVTLSKVTAGSKQATLNWKTVTGATGYEIVYSTSKDFKKSKKTTTIKKQSTKKTTIKKLTKGKKYYFKVRAYKTVDGKKIYSAYSSVKSVKVK